MFALRVRKDGADGGDQKREPVKAEPVKIIRDRKERFANILKRFPKTIEYLGR